MKIKLIFFVSVIVLSGCKENNNYINYFKLNNFEKQTKLFATKIIESGINFPYTMEIFGKYFIIYDLKSVKQIKIIEIESHKLLNSFGCQGQGPGEFISPSVIFRDKKDNNAFWIFDMPAMRLSKFNIYKILNDDFLPETIIVLPIEKCGYVNHLLMTPDEQFLGVGFFTKGRIAAYNMDGSFIRSIGKVPTYSGNDKFAMHHSHGFTGRIVYRNKSKEMFVATQLGTVIEKYNISGNLIATFIGPDSFSPEYDIVQAGSGLTMSYNNKTRFGYLDICYNENLDRLFLLYSGKHQFVKNRSNRAYIGNIIYVIDENGVVTTRYNLDEEIHHMCISDDGSLLIGLSEEAIYKFNLNDQHKG